MNKSIEQLVLEFFVILDTVEESDSGRKFHPTRISSCRVIHTDKLSKILPEMKRLASERSKGW